MNEPKWNPAKELADLRAEVQALRKDAARYRWLNGPDSEWEPFDSGWLSQHDLYGQFPADMDAFIDSAIQGEKG